MFLRPLLPTLRSSSSSTSALLLPPPAALFARHASSSSSSPKRPPLKSPILRDEAIPHSTVSLVDPATKALLPPARLVDLLLQLDRERFVLQLVDVRKEEGAGEERAVCRILEKKELFARGRKTPVKSPANAEPAAAEVAAPASSSKAGGPPKEVQLTWGVTVHDLGHKLKKARELLGQGRRVSVVLKEKKGVDKVGGEQRERVMQGIRGEMDKCGAKLKKEPREKSGAVILEFGAE